MAQFYESVSRTFSEYLLVPNLTTKECFSENINLKTPLVKYKKGETPDLSLSIPFVSAIMQSVSNDTLAVALAKSGGISFIFCSQPIREQVEMVRKVKKFKAGFVISDSNVKPDDTLEDIIKLKEKTGHSTMAVTHDGTSNGKLMGIVTGRDYRLSRHSRETKVSEFMTPLDNLITGELGISLKKANK